MTWLRQLEIRDLRNIHEARLELGGGLNVFLGRNAQGKTSLLEGVGLLARGRSFRTEDGRDLIRRGASGLCARGRAQNGSGETALEVRLAPGERRLFLDGREVGAGDYQGRLEAFVYSTDRLRVVRGPMRERRAFLDRGASLLWPSYRQLGRDYQRVVEQRNAALEHDSRDLAAWSERLAEVGGSLRFRREGYASRLRLALEHVIRPEGERYELRLRPTAGGSEEECREGLRAEVARSLGRERRVRTTLVGPHRDSVFLGVDGHEAATAASSGQARSLLLALTLAAIAVYREETGDAAVALLDDLDSELDEERSLLVCQEVVRRGQALVTTAHRAWAERLAGIGRVYEVCEGTVTAGNS